MILPVLDDNSDENKTGYEDVYDALKRVQEIISQRSAKGAMDDSGVLSKTLSKLVETCSDDMVMRLWSENPRVCAFKCLSVNSINVSLSLTCLYHGWSQEGIWLKLTQCYGKVLAYRWTYLSH